MHVVRRPCATPANANGDAHDARTDDEQATDRNQHEPREIEAEEPRRVLTLAQCTNRLVTAIGAVVDAVAHQIRVDAKRRHRAPEVLAGVFWREGQWWLRK